MSADSSWDLQQAVYGALTGDSALMALVRGVYDHVPQGSAFPYVVIGEGTARAWGAAGLDGIEATLAIHVWSRERGLREIKTVSAEIHRIPHDASLALAGHTLVSLRFAFAESALEPDGATRHGVISFRAVTHTP